MLFERRRYMGSNDLTVTNSPKIVFRNPETKQDAPDFMKGIEVFLVDIKWKWNSKNIDPKMKELIQKTLNTIQYYSNKGFFTKEDFKEKIKNFFIYEFKMSDVSDLLHDNLKYIYKNDLEPFENNPNLYTEELEKQFKDDLNLFLDAIINYATHQNHWNQTKPNWFGIFGYINKTKSIQELEKYLGLSGNHEKFSEDDLKFMVFDTVTPSAVVSEKVKVSSSATVKRSPLQSKKNNSRNENITKKESPGSPAIVNSSGAQTCSSNLVEALSSKSDENLRFNSNHEKSAGIHVTPSFVSQLNPPVNNIGEVNSGISLGEDEQSGNLKIEDPRAPLVADNMQDEELKSHVEIPKSEMQEEAANEVDSPKVERYIPEYSSQVATLIGDFPTPNKPKLERKNRYIYFIGSDAEGVDLFSLDANSKTVFDNAAEKGRKEFTKAVKQYLPILKKDGRLKDLFDVQAESITELSLLHYAVMFENAKLVEFLLKNDHREDVEDSGQRTPLHLAVECGNLEIVKMLVKERKVSIVYLDNKFRTPLHLACLKNHTNIVEYIVSVKDIFGEEIFSPSPRDKYEMTPLQMACYNGNFDIVKILCRFIKNKESFGESLDIYHKDNSGKTAIEIAEIKGFKDIAEYLKKLSIEGKPDRKNEQSAAS